MVSQRLFFPVLLSGLLAVPRSCSAFAPARVVTGTRPAFHRVFSSTADDIQSMRAGAIKTELESYGISTKSFLEKSELVDALKKARSDGLQPKTSASTSASTSSPSSTDSSRSEPSSPPSSSAKPREERLKEEMENCQKFKAGELKKELEELGISTKSFFEKSEFVKALAEARVDGVEKESTESYAEYADVEVITDDSAGPRKKQDGTEQQQSPFGGKGPDPFAGGAGAGGNPFAGGMGGMGGIADMMGGMGGMGGIADMMGGMGGAGGMMGKAQELMKNPKVMEMMMKAQSNPKLMKAMQECMSNPAAFAKYQNDPEVSELINELRQYM